MVESEELHRKYRPTSFDTIIGQQPIVESLMNKIKDKTKAPHSYIFTGPPGVGKTTLSRILANELGCVKENILEIDGASFTGIDDMREVVSVLRYTGFGDTPNKCLILDECHRISANAWDSLLKFIEEPPTHVYVALCTTNISKIPDTIRTRCHEYHLKEIKDEDILLLLSIVCDCEKISMDSGILTLIARKAKGSARRGLVLLSKCAGISDTKQILSVLDEVKDDEGNASFLCKFIVSGKGTWDELVKALKAVKDEQDSSCESVRISICNYLNACIINSKSKEEALSFMKKLSPFSKPFSLITGMSDLLLCIGDNF